MPKKLIDKVAVIIGATKGIGKEGMYVIERSQREICVGRFFGSTHNFFYFWLLTTWHIRNLPTISN